MAPDLIQSPLFVRHEKRKLLYLRQGLGHEGLREIEPLLASDNVFHSPSDPLGGFERSLVTVIILHDQSSFCFCSPLPLAMRKRRKYAKIESVTFGLKKP